MRTIKKTALLLSILIMFYGLNKSISWYKVYKSDGKYVYKSNGNYLSFSEARKVSNDYNSDYKYYYKYTILKHYKTHTFPFTSCNIDTLNSSLWSRKRNTNNN